MWESPRIAPGVSPPKLRNRVAPWAWSVLVLLVLQNLLGIYLNLYVALPQGSDLLGLMAAYSVLGAHVIVGILLLVSTGAVLFLTARTRRRSLWIPALASLVFTFLAFESGIEFVIHGQDNLFSFLMELGFIGVVASDALVLYQAGRHPEAAGGGRSVLSARE